LPVRLKPVYIVGWFFSCRITDYYGIIFCMHF